MKIVNLCTAPIGVLAHFGPHGTEREGYTLPVAALAHTEDEETGDWRIEPIVMIRNRGEFAASQPGFLSVSHTYPPEEPF